MADILLQRFCFRERERVCFRLVEREMDCACVIDRSRSYAIVRVTGIRDGRALFRYFHARARFWQPDRLAQLKNPKTIHFLNGFSSAMAPALRGAPGTSEKTEIGAIAPPHARPPVQRRRPEAPARRKNRPICLRDKMGGGLRRKSQRAAVSGPRKPSREI